MENEKNTHTLTGNPLLLTRAESTARAKGHPIERYFAATYVILDAAQRARGADAAAAAAAASTTAARGDSNDKNNTKGRAIGDSKGDAVDKSIGGGNSTDVGVARTTKQTPTKVKREHRAPRGYPGREGVLERESGAMAGLRGAGGGKLPPKRLQEGDSGGGVGARSKGKLAALGANGEEPRKPLGGDASDARGGHGCGGRGKGIGGKAVAERVGGGSTPAALGGATTAGFTNNADDKGSGGVRLSGVGGYAEPSREAKANPSTGVAGMVDGSVDGGVDGGDSNACGFTNSRASSSAASRGGLGNGAASVISVETDCGLEAERGRDQSTSAKTLRMDVARAVGGRGSSDSGGGDGSGDRASGSVEEGGGVVEDQSSIYSKDDDDEVRGSWSTHTFCCRKVGQQQCTTVVRGHSVVPHTAR